MLNAIIATIIPTIILMIILLTSLASLKDQPWVQGMTQAVVPVVGVMLAVLTWQFVKKSKQGLGWTPTILLALITGVLMEWLNIHPGIIIAGLLISALLKLAMGNALPGPIATKMAGYIGFQQAGIAGASVGIFATVAPSLILMITLLSILYKYKDSPKVKRMTMYIRPTIAVLLGLIAFRFFFSSYEGGGVWHTSFLIITSFILLEKVKLHPAFVIVGALGYGALFMS